MSTDLAHPRLQRDDGKARLFRPATRTSAWGWLVAKMLVRLLLPKHHDVERFRREYRRSQRAGPARPPERMAKRLGIKEQSIAGTDCFRTRISSAASTPRAVLYLHGGAYVFEMIAPQWTIVAALAEKTGAEVVAPRYPLAPDGTVLEGLDAVERVYHDLVGRFGAHRVALAGDSAGGGLALALAQRLRDGGEPSPAALLLLFPWLDVALSAPEQVEAEARDPTLSSALLREAGRLWAGALPLTDPRPSPLFGDLANLPPTLAQVGDDDLLAADARRLARLSDDVILEEYDRMFHGWSCAPIPEGRLALKRACVFLVGRFAEADRKASSEPRGRSSA